MIKLAMGHSTWNGPQSSRGSDRWWEHRWWLRWGDMRSKRWTRIVNRMRLTEWRRELIPQVRWCICERAVGDL